MNLLLIFFALPIAVIIFSIILQKLLNNPLLVASFVFAIFLVVTFAAFDATFLIATFAYTLLAFITALIVQFFCNSNENHHSICRLLNNILDNLSQNTNDNNDDDDDNECDAVEQILNNNNNSSNNSNISNSCGCNRYRRRY